MMKRIAALLSALLPVLACTAPGTAPAQEAVEFPPDWPYAADAEPVRATRGLVSTTDAHATQVGLEILRAGGNAVDATVAVSFALAVVNPEAGNIGGGGFLVTRLADGTTAALDFREKAPLASTRDMFLDEEGNPTDRSIVGHLASGVPGTVMGMWNAHRRFGSLAWAELVQPAIELARGFEVHPRLAGSLATHQERLRIFPAAERAFLPGGAPPSVGDTLRQLDLAATLERIRDRGPDDFYRGRTAELLVAEMERGGGIITRRDLEAYETVWRDPVRFRYRDHTVVTMPPVSSGGATMAEAAHILEAWDLGAMGYHSPEHVHLLAEAWKRAFADRNTYLADPAFVDVPLERMTSREYAAVRREGISMERATPSLEVSGGMGDPDTGEHTTHVSVVDREGNAVAMTYTVNASYGSRVVVAGGGFILNNEMDDLSAKPGEPNMYGLVEGEANAVEPGKRPLSSMTPTLVLRPDGELLLVIGSPGGPRIITTVMQTISNVVDFGMNVVQAVHAPRVHHQHLPDEIRYEGGGLPAETIARLSEIGHTLAEHGGVMGDVQAIMVLPDGTLEGVSDPRRGGSALGY